MVEGISIWIVLLCIAAAFLAGFVDAVAGGGGLIQLPTLLVSLPNMPLATLMGTNKSVSIIGTTAAANTYRKKIPINSSIALPMVVSAFFGSLGGSALVSNVSRSWFEPIILVILICVAIFTILKPEFGQHEKVIGESATLKAALLGGGIGFYDGLIGPGTGMFLLFGLISVLGVTFLQGSATAKFVNVVTNAASLVIFIPSGHIIWLLALVMAPANYLGGLIGAETAIDKGSYFVRTIFIVMLIVLITRFFFTLFNLNFF